MRRLGLLVLATCLLGDSSPRWSLVSGRHWMIEGTTVEEACVTDAREGTGGGCPAGMVAVRGMSRTDGGGVSVEGLQDSVCMEWIGHAFPRRCARFDRERWRMLVTTLPVQERAFCIDRFEYPDAYGAYPMIFVTWMEAGAACATLGKRLCSEDEWTFACEGEEALPYPHGYEREAGSCVIDRPHRAFDETRFRLRSSVEAEQEISRLWQGEASGSRPRCRSPFGVYDLTGNVDEWTTSTRGGGYRSILKGGYWGPVRTRCRPSTRAHGEDFAYYQQGFRCCSGLPVRGR